MATLNNQYIFVKDEEVSFGVDVTEHTVEKGVAISDHVKRHAVQLSITGELVGPNASSVRSKLRQMHQNGTVCSYSGRSTLNNCLIVDFSTSHPSTISGGCEFSMTLKEIRTASTSYKAETKKNTGTQQVTQKSKEEYVYHKVKKGDCVWNLVAASNAPYKKYGWSCNKVMSENQDAFSRRGDFRTLRIGYNLKVGKR